MMPRILVVDDEQKWREQIKDVLEIMSCEVDIVQGFKEANEILKRQRYDLAVLDICLDQFDPSYMEFQTFCVFLREKNPGLPILAVSGEKIEPSFMFNLRDQGVADFVSKKDFLVPDFKRRVEDLLHKAGSSPNVNVVSILFLAADPTDAARLRLDKEFREIREKLRLAAQRDRFRLELPQLSVRPADISQALLECRPNIVHFSGHGTPSGALCFEAESGSTHLIQPAALAALFEQFVDQVNCVVLNACYSEAQAKALARHVAYIIGMNQEVGDEAAIAFSVGFYQGLGAGRTIEEAYKLGVAQIGMKDFPERLKPVLIKKG